MEAHRGNLSLALSEFDGARRPDMHALAHLDLIAPQVRLGTLFATRIVQCIPYQDHSVEVNVWLAVFLDDV